MKLTISNIYDIPFHDADFVGMYICQHDDGMTSLHLKIMLAEEELGDLEGDAAPFVQGNGSCTLLFKDCRAIKSEFFCNNSKRDEIDYITLENEGGEIARVHASDEELLKAKVTLISGSTIECFSKSVSLSKG